MGYGTPAVSIFVLVCKDVHSDVCKRMLYIVASKSLIQKIHKIFNSTYENKVMFFNMLQPIYQ